MIEPGEKFGNLEVIKRLNYEKGIFRCACGTEKEFFIANVTYGKSKSCGCLQKKAVALRMTKHGQAGKNYTPEYQAWSGLKFRCRHDPDYYKRGIKFCERWNEFANFLLDMGLRPSSKHSVNRIDNNGDYEPGNCEWATYTQQNRNKRNNIIVVYKNRKTTLAALAEESGLKLNTLYQRIFTCKMPIEDAVSRPLVVRNRRKNHG